MRIAVVMPCRWIFGEAPAADEKAADSLLQVSGHTAEDSIVATLVQIRCDHVANSTCDGEQIDDRKYRIYQLVQNDPRPDSLTPR